VKLVLHPPLAADDTVKFGFYILTPAGVLGMQEASGEEHAAEPTKLAAKSDKSQWGSLLNQLKQKLD
jgi:hypothetical protein